MISVHIYDIQIYHLVKPYSQSRQKNAQTPKLQNDKCLPALRQTPSCPKCLHPCALQQAKHGLHGLLVTRYVPGPFLGGIAPAFTHVNRVNHRVFTEDVKKQGVFVSTGIFQKKQLAQKKNTSNSVPYHPCMVYLPKFG